MITFDDLKWYQKLQVKEVLQKLDEAVSISEAKQILKTKSKNEPVFKNPDLQLIDFALRHVSPYKYTFGILYEIFIWTIFIITSLLSAVFLTTISILLLGAPGYGIYYFIDSLKKNVPMLKHLRFLARRMRRNAYLKLITDERAPVLYLRSFSEDRTDLVNKDGRRIEDRLAEYYEQFGPVIAVAGPADTKMSYGAVKIYFDDDTWRCAVTYLISISQLVIIQQGTSKGTLWELGMAKRILPPDKLIISLASSVDPDIAEDCETFRTYAEPIMKNEFPIMTDNNLFVAFDQNWRPLIKNQKGEWVAATTISTISRYLENTTSATQT